MFQYFFIGPPFFSQSGMPPTLRTFLYPISISVLPVNAAWPPTPQISIISASFLRLLLQSGVASSATNSIRPLGISRPSKIVPVFLMSELSRTSIKIADFDLCFSIASFTSIFFYNFVSFLKVIFCCFHIVLHFILVELPYKLWLCNRSRHPTIFAIFTYRCFF